MPPPGKAGILKKSPRKRPAARTTVYTYKNGKETIVMTSQKTAKRKTVWAW